MQPSHAGVSARAGGAAGSNGTAAAAASLEALCRMAAAAAALSDVDVLSADADATLPVSGPCARAHRDRMLPVQQAHPARNAFLVAAAADWQLQQERVRTPDVPWQEAQRQQQRQQQQQQQQLGAVPPRPPPTAAATAASGPAADLVASCQQLLCSSGGAEGGGDGSAAAAWVAQLAVRGDSGTVLQAVLAAADEDVSTGMFGREPLGGSYTSELGVAQAVGELLLRHQLAAAASGVAPVSGDGHCVLDAWQQQQQQQQQYPRHRLSSLANVLLLAGPPPQSLGSGGAGAVDRLSSLAAIARAEACRQAGMAAGGGGGGAGRASRRGPVVEHYLARRLHNLAHQPHLLHELEVAGPVPNWSVH
jgi:hypothetical protein